jgi:hypothetical protein
MTTPVVALPQTPTSVEEDGCRPESLVLFRYDSLGNRYRGIRFRETD